MTIKIPKFYDAFFFTDEHDNNNVLNIGDRRAAIMEARSSVESNAEIDVSQLRSIASDKSDPHAVKREKCKGRVEWNADSDVSPSNSTASENSDSHTVKRFEFKHRVRSNAETDVSPSRSTECESSVSHTVIREQFKRRVEYNTESDVSRSRSIASENSDLRTVTRVQDKRGVESNSESYVSPSRSNASDNSDSHVVKRVKCERRVESNAKSDVSPSRSIASENSDSHTVKRVKCERQQSNERKLTSKFTIHLSPSEFHAIEPTSRYQRLRQPWTNVLYKHFNRKWPECALKFSYNHCKKPDSRKKCSFGVGRAQCKVDGKCVKVKFDIDTRPSPGAGVDVKVIIFGTCTHRNPQQIEQLQPTSPNRRFLSGEDRITAAETLRKTLQTPTSMYQKEMAKLNVAQIEAGNTTACKHHKC